MVKEITSTQNQNYKFIKSLKSKKARDKSGKYTVEGIKSVRDAIFAGADIDALVISDSCPAEFEHSNIFRVPESLFTGLCDTETPQGVMAVINMNREAVDLTAEKLILYCDHVSDPGNMGTIIRICDAVDCALVLSEEAVDIYNPKTVRASMGSFFHTRIAGERGIDALKSLKDSGYKIFSGALGENTVDYNDADYNGKTVLVVGNEANGISDEVLAMSDKLVKIPIWGRAESLNVAVAAAILLYEAKK